MSKKVKKNGEVMVGILATSAEALNFLLTQPLNPVTAFRVSRVAKDVQPILEDYEKQRNDLITKYGEKNGEGVLKVTDKNIDKFADELTPLLEEKVAMNIPEIHSKDLGGIEITPRFIQALDWLIKE